jgi:hypothetical protein
MVEVRIQDTHKEKHTIKLPAKWTELYRKFMKKHKKKLWKFRYHFPQLKNM